MSNKLKIIETTDYILAVSDEEIKNDEYYVSWETNYSTEPKERYVIYVRGSGLNGTNPKKIIAYQPKGNAPELDLSLLPEMGIEDDVEKLALQDFKDNDDGFVSYKDRTEGFISGYKAATKTFSEEDLKKAIDMCIDLMRDKYTEFRTHKETIIQSLKQPKWFVAEVIDTNSYGSEVLTGSYDSGNFKLKTTTIEGKTYLVGKFIN